mmetsp:Transcript_26734/g.4774  ORF Transcript_26734/g.4774 Transcript_26734/m.4774 type:complete len:142 (-) Transcript_26734:258-683(-)
MTTKDNMLDFSPSTSNFRQLNVERSIFKSASNLTMSSSYDNNITQLIPAENIDEDNNPIRKFANIAGFSNSTIIELRNLLGGLVENPREALQILADRLNLLIPCERARLLLLDKTQDNLIDPATGSVFRMQGLAKKCFESC